MPTTPPQGDDGTLVGGFLLLLEQEGESFYVRITNPTAVGAVDAIIAGTRSFQSVSGPILANGPNAPAYYGPWRWHIDPARVVLNRLPDPANRYEGRPSEVEANLQSLVAGRETSKCSSARARTGVDSYARSHFQVVRIKCP